MTRLTRPGVSLKAWQSGIRARIRGRRRDGDVLGAMLRETSALPDHWMERDFQPMPNRAHPEMMVEFMDRMMAEDPDYDLAYLLEDYSKVASILDPSSALNSLNPYYQGEIPKAPETTPWQCDWCGSSQAKERLSCEQCGGSHDSEHATHHRAR